MPHNEDHDRLGEIVRKLDLLLAIKTELKAHELETVQAERSRTRPLQFLLDEMRPHIRRLEALRGPGKGSAIEWAADELERRMKGDDDGS